MVPFSVSVFCWSYRIPWRRREKYARKKSTIFLPGEIRVGPLSFASFTHRSHRILSLQTRIRNRLRKNKKKKRRHHRRRRFIWYAFCVRFAYHSFHTPFMMSSARSFHLPSRFMDISLCFSSELINTAHMLTQNGP